jgi:hypothetical protein
VNLPENLLQAAWGSFESQFQDCLVGLKAANDEIELEAIAANMEAENTRFETIKRMLEANAVRKETTKIRLPCHQIPFPRNPRFSGRQDVLSYIDKTISPSATGQQQKSLSLAGMGGLGKTQVVLEYVWLHSAAFKAILWLQSDSAAKILQGFADFAQSCGLVTANDGADMVQTCDTVKRWLSESKGKFSLPFIWTSEDNMILDIPWLVIFDNVDDGAILANFWPAATHGHILITTRNTVPTFTPASTTYRLQPLGPDEGSKLLETSLKAVSNNALYDSAESRESAIQLSKDLGGLPLAICQIAAFISTSFCTVAEFREIFKSQQDMNEVFEEPGGNANFHYEHTLATVWDLSFSKLDSDSVSFLEIVAFLDPDSIPEMLLHRAGHAVPQCERVLKTKSQYAGNLKLSLKESY